MSDPQSQGRILLKKGRDKIVRQRHPWVFSGAIQTVERDPQPGEIVSVFNAGGDFLAQGFYNPNSQIQLRLLTDQKVTIDSDFFRERLRQAIAFRDQEVPYQARRLVHAEADGLPGLVVDQYGDCLSLQFSALGMSLQRERILEILQDELQPRLIVERSESPSLKLEGMQPFKGIVAGSGEAYTEIVENGARFAIDLLEGQKTGFFVDQRDSRALIGKLAAGKRLLNCFSYSGGFSLLAALQGATTTSVEISAAAQDLARQNFSLNGIDLTNHRFETANVFDYLRELDSQYDVMVLDPPAFMKRQKDLQKGSRAYQDINRLAIKQSLPNGLILSCSCSHYLSWDLFQKVVFSAALEAGRSVQIVQRLGQPLDHPVSLFHPEGEYLKAFLLRVL